MSTGIYVSYDIRWRIRPLKKKNRAVDTSQPGSLVVDSVFSLTAPISAAVPEAFIREWSLEIDDSHYSIDPTTITVPWIIVEYVKYLNGSSVTRSVHETHLLGTLDAALRFYRWLHIDLPIYGFLIDGYEITVYTAAIGKVSETSCGAYYCG
jgi:hypothetical protein